MDKLKPCHFCGCAAHYWFYNNMAVVYCPVCGADMRGESDGHGKT